MAITLDGTTGITTPGLTNTGTETIVNLTTTGNTTLGDATSDTLTVGVTGIVKDASGNVGIGTASPAQKLHIQQTSAAASLTQLVLQNADNTAGTGSAIGFANHTSSGLLTGKLESAIDGANAYSLRFYTYQSTLNERMRIDASGNLMVGTTSQIGAEQVGISFADASKNGLGIQVQASTSGAAFAVFRNSSGTLIGSITRNTTTNAVLYNTSSDYRLKENITPLTNALARVSALKPVQWSWKDCDGAVGEGFIAHEVQDVVPAAVSGEKDAVDAEGNIKPQGMDSSYLVATLTAAIQEQQALITALTTRITALETLSAEGTSNGS
jgi:hypothetical protein